MFMFHSAKITLVELLQTLHELFIGILLGRLVVLFSHFFGSDCRSLVNILTVESIDILCPVESGLAVRRVHILWFRILLFSHLGLQVRVQDLLFLFFNSFLIVQSLSVPSN